MRMRSQRCVLLRIQFLSAINGQLKSPSNIYIKTCGNPQGTAWLFLGGS